jgi:hypothetical protein
VTRIPNVLQFGAHLILDFFAAHPSVTYSHKVSSIYIKASVCVSVCLYVQD